MGTRGFDMGCDFRIAGRGAVNPRKSGGKKFNWRKKASTGCLEQSRSSAPIPEGVEWAPIDGVQPV